MAETRIELNPGADAPQKGEGSHPLTDLDDFFLRNGLSQAARQACDGFAQLHFPDERMRPLYPQGYCSYTLEASALNLVQFRPIHYQLNLGICAEAKRIYRDVVPDIKYLGLVEVPRLEDDDESDKCVLHAYAIERAVGVNLSAFREIPRSPSDAKTCRWRLIGDLARVFATSYINSEPRRLPQRTRGKVGSSLRWRLDLLLKNLPSPSLVRHAREVEHRWESIKEAPWCLTHGDLLPSNIMVDPETGHLTGLIDWAEGEWLPFGIGLYGLEEVLGEQIVPGGQFQYFDDHDDLRDHFWSSFSNYLSEMQPSLRQPRLVDAKVGRKFGIMLWHGIAFDNGRIDRVVETGTDDAELQKLELFLPTWQRKSGSPRNGDHRVRVVTAWWERLSGMLVRIWCSKGLLWRLRSAENIFQEF